MNNLINAIRAAIAEKNWHGAMFIALTLPDICGKIDNPNYIARAWGKHAHIHLPGDEHRRRRRALWIRFMDVATARSYMTYPQRDERGHMALNNHYQPRKPASHSIIRITLGKLYFTWRRYFHWIFNRSIRYASGSREIELSTVVAAHKTSLYRQLRNVDMWLQENKVTNLKLACGKLNKVILKPGETFSFWRLVGKPTQAKGYLRGMVLTNGLFSAGVGGGLCQLSNLIYWMTLHTPLTVTERWRHTHDVFPDSNRTQPFGSGATVVYNYVDLQIRNGISTSG